MWLLWAGLAALWCIIIMRRSTGGRRLPPGPTPLPLIGNLLNLRGVFHQTLVSLARIHGPVMTIKLGITTVIVISSSDAAREAYTKHDRRLAAHAMPDAICVTGYVDRGMVLLPSSDPLWKTLRGIQATHIFSPRGLEVARCIRERKVGDIISNFRMHTGKEVLVYEVLHTGLLNLASSSFFSVDNLADVPGLRELVEEIVMVLTKPNVSDLFPFLKALDMQGLRRRTGKNIDKVFRILDGIIERRMANTNKQHGDFLDVLLELLSTEKITRHHVTDMLFDVFLAGGDTMSATIEWAMAELLRNPSVMAKVRAEMADVLGSKEIIEEQDASRLPYLQAVLKEAMRLHPVGPILFPHKAVEDGVEIGGYAVPKGSTVIFNAWGIMRDPDAWERPEEFLPERFLQRQPQLDFRGKEYAFLPFGSGRRLCPGLPLAERVVPFVLASLIHAFEWRLPGTMLAEELDMTENLTSLNFRAVRLKAVPVLVS